MDTRELYDELCAIWSKQEDNCIHFTKRMIKENDTPDNCQHCIFRVGLGAHFCQVLQKYVDFTDEPQCTVYDFVKYMLKRI